MPNAAKENDSARLFDRREHEFRSVTTSMHPVTTTRTTSQTVKMLTLQVTVAPTTAEISVPHPRDGAPYARYVEVSRWQKQQGRRLSQQGLTSRLLFVGSLHDRKYVCYIEEMGVQNKRRAAGHLRTTTPLPRPMLKRPLTVPLFTMVAVAGAVTVGKYRLLSSPPAPITLCCSSAGPPSKGRSHTQESAARNVGKAALPSWFGRTVTPYRCRIET